MPVSVSNALEVIFPGPPRGPLMPIPEDEPCEWSASHKSFPSNKRRRRNETGVSSYDNSLVNKERLKHKLPLMKRSAFLEHFAMIHAKAMAARCVVEHSADNAQELGAVLQSDIVGENVQSGRSIRSMHAAQSKVLRQNILGEFTQHGMATAKGVDGKLYLCQLFRSV